MTGVRRHEVDDPGVAGVVFEPERRTEHGAVVLPGSGGGIPEGYAMRLAELGVGAFALGYFGLPGLPSTLVEVPLEQVAHGVAVFRDRLAGAEQIGVMGSSKGAELALLLASYRPDLVGSVVAVAPSCVSWYGLDQTDPTSMRRPSWTWRGQPVPFLPYRQHVAPSWSDAGLRLDMCYEFTAYADTEIDTARIPVEQATGPILLISGDDDHMWPSAAMADQLVDRLAANDRGAQVTSVVYAGAGHAFLHREFLPDDVAAYWDFGGSTEADAVARSAACPHIASFLRGEQ